MNPSKKDNVKMASAQQDLLSSSKTSNLSEFKRAIAKGANVNLRQEGSLYSVFEMICETPQSSKFIETCIKHNASVAEMNPITKEYPIHLAACSLDSKNLEELLSAQAAKKTVEIQIEGMTALMLLFTMINKGKWERVFECIKVLLRYHANINTKNANGITPLTLLVTDKDEWRKQVLDYCLEHCNVETSECELRNAIKNHFPEVIIPDYIVKPTTLESQLSVGTDEHFLVDYEIFCNQTGGSDLKFDDRKKLLSVAVEESKLRSAKKLYEDCVPKEKCGDLLAGLLDKWAGHGDAQMLRWLLEIIPKDKMELLQCEGNPLLSQLIKRIDRKKDCNECPFYQSIAILLKDGRIEIDQKDNNSCTALHYAVLYHHQHVQKLLLDHGAYIGAENESGDLPITEMDPYLLEDHFNSCISPISRPCDDDFRLEINFFNFVSPMVKHSNTNKLHKAHEDELRPILQIARTPGKKRILRHPVIWSILMLKWMIIAKFFYINLIICTIFFVSVIMYIATYYTPYRHVFFFISLLFWLCLIARESVQLIHNTKEYVTSLVNGIEVLLILAFGVIVANELMEVDDSICRAAMGSAVLLLGLELTFLVGTLPSASISIHMVILKTTSKNFFKCFLLYSIILLAFAFSFYSLFRTNGKAKLNGFEEKANGSEKTGDGFNNFEEIALTLMKTAVMLTGELDASNINFHTSWFNYIVFTLFLFSVPIVLFNLINGLAVSDTSAIKSDSEIVAITQKVLVIDKYEQMLKTFNSTSSTVPKFLSWACPTVNLQLFPKVVKNNYITVQPRTKKILISRSMENIAPDGKRDSENPIETDIVNWTMDSKIVKYALQIADPNYDNIERMEYRLMNIHNNLYWLMEMHMHLKKTIESQLKTNSQK